MESLYFFGGFGRKVCAGLSLSKPAVLKNVVSVQTATVPIATKKNDLSQPDFHCGSTKYEDIDG